VSKAAKPSAPAIADNDLSRAVRRISQWLDDHLARSP
jgi:hypothetical protein